MNELGQMIVNAQITNKVYQDFINESMNSGDPIDWWELNNLARRSSIADKALKERMAQVKDEPCSCDPVTGSVCGPCWVDNQARYPHIPFGGE